MTFSANSAADAVTFQRVTKAFGATKALDAVGFSVPRGELFGLVGGNGAGKTTLIKCLLDFCGADSGEIAIFGTSSRTTAARGNIAFLPERFTPPYYLTGRDFLLYMTELHGRVYDETLVTDMFQRLDLDVSALRRPARSYSKGMTQKLGLAACLLSRKALLVLDEPTSGLDPKARARLKRELRGLRETGTTVFLTSHALADVDEICDRMAVLDRGRMRYVGTPAELITTYGGRGLEEAFLSCIDQATV